MKAQFTADAAFLLVWATVLCAPLIAFLTLPDIRGSWPSAQVPIIIAALFGLCLAFGLAALRLTFTNVWANVALWTVTYFAYCFLAAWCWHIPRKTIRYLAAFVTALPICVGYIVGTIGFLALGLLVSDNASPPYHIEQMGTDLVCETTGWGMAGGPSGYKVHLYKRWPRAFPFIEKEVMEFTVDQNASDADKTCSDALSAYAHQRAN